jgi:glyoxylase-like metal-dependent hydrolase (beta-lactamase superfamily II)
MSELTRRTLLAGSALAATSAALPLAVNPGAAAAPPAGKQAAAFYRYKLGDFEITAIHDGLFDWPVNEAMVPNRPFPEVQKALADAFLPTDKMPIPITSLVVNTGSKLIVLDTGTAGQFAKAHPRTGTWNANFAAAGFDPKAVDTVVISHFHADHINGIRDKDGKLTFPNAEIMVPAPEWAHWMDDAKMSATPEARQFNFKNSRRVFGDIAKDVKRFEWDKEVTPGITAIAAPGHTPGHTVFAIASGNQSVLHLVDTTNNPYVWVRHPEWHFASDEDKPLAVENRKKLLDRATADKMRVQGYHFPFPASGYITKSGTGYEVNPVMWQPV